MPEQRIAAVQCRTFVDRIQESLKDFISTIGNFVIFVKSLVDFDLKDQTTYRLILQQMSNLVDIVQDVNYFQLHDAALPESHWIPHHLLYLL